MNKYVKEFFKRGLMFGGFGCIVIGIVLWCIQLSGTDVAMGGGDIFIAIVSGYLLAFFHAGVSVLNQIESWSIGKATGLHFISLYAVYLLCYLINRWIDFRLSAVAIFTGIFVGVYVVVWLTVYIATRGVSRKLNDKLGE